MIRGGILRCRSSALIASRATSSTEARGRVVNRDCEARKAATVAVRDFLVVVESMRNWRDCSETHSIVGLGSGHIEKWEVGGLVTPSGNGYSVGGYVILSTGSCKQ
jgi:hypothetical protein